MHIKSIYTVLKIFIENWDALWSIIQEIIELEIKVEEV